MGPGPDLLGASKRPHTDEGTAKSLGPRRGGTGRQNRAAGALSLRDLSPDGLYASEAHELFTETQGLGVKVMREALTKTDLPLGFTPDWEHGGEPSGGWRLVGRPEVTRTCSEAWASG